MKKFRKKPIVIEAVQWDGTNKMMIDDFIGDCGICKGDLFSILTLEGTMTANCGDWIIKGVNGEFYPCKNDIFEKTYEEVEE